MSVAHTLTYTHPSLTTKNVSRHCQIFPMVQTVPQWEPPTYNTRSSPPPNHFLFLTEEYSTLFTSICACVLSHLSRVRLFVTLWAVAHQALLSMGFSRQEYWVGCHFLLQGDLPDSGIKPRSPALQADSLLTELWGKRMTNLDTILKSRDITLPTKVHLVIAMVFPVVMCGCESWTIKKAECWRIDAFEL